MISFGPTEEQALVRDTLREFAAEVLRPAAREQDEASEPSDAILGQLHELGAATPDGHRRVGDHEVADVVTRCDSHDGFGRGCGDSVGEVGPGFGL